MSSQPSREKIVLVHRAGTATEALVIRSLLESAGISSPAPTVADPFPLREPPKGFNDTDIIVLESQSDDARSLIADHLSHGPLREDALDLDAPNPVDPDSPR